MSPKEWQRGCHAFKLWEHRIHVNDQADELI